MAVHLSLLSETGRRGINIDQAMHRIDSVYTSTQCALRLMWRHLMETLSALLAFVRGIHRSHVNSPNKGQWRRALMFSLICAWINGWVNNRKAGDWRLHRAHYDVTVMLLGIYIEPMCLESPGNKQPESPGNNMGTPWFSASYFRKHEYIFMHHICTTLRWRR